MRVDALRGETDEMVVARRSENQGEADIGIRRHIYNVTPQVNDILAGLCYRKLGTYNDQSLGRRAAGHGVHAVWGQDNAT
jgi:hypothetical protein